MSVQLGEWKDSKLYIEGLEYPMPKMPPKKEILNYGLPKEKQVWSRIITYEDFYWGDGWEELCKDNEAQLKYMYDEISRVSYGCWVYIYGEPVYLNNYMYFFLQWFLLEDGEYPQFRDAALYYYRFVEICDKTNTCAGHTLLKARRLGATSMALSALQLLLLTTTNSNFGIVSNKGNNASKAFERAVKSMGNLPAFLRPVQEGTTAPKKKLSLREQAKRISKVNQKGAAQGGLNNELSWENTDLNSYDSYALRGILLDECLDPETKIMMADGNFKTIKSVNVGDYVMTEGTIPRKVMNKFEGVDEMFRVNQPYGKDYIVSSKHRLLIDHRMGGGNKLDGQYILTPKEILTKFPKSSYRVLSRVTSKGLDYEEAELPITPYLFGLWLGDGHSDCFRIIVNTKTDPEILEYLKEYAIENGFKYSIKVVASCKSVVNFSILKHTDSKSENKHARELVSMGVRCNKHIPDIYFRSSRQQRLELLAGIIDTDGHSNDNGKKGSISIGMSRENLIRQIKYLAESCGLSVSNVKHKHTNLDTSAYLINISGDLNLIPTKVKRKTFELYTKSYNSRRNKLSVESIGVGQYVGIQVEADNDEGRKLILEDFTLTMNCGKYPREVPVNKYIPIVLKTLKKGARIVGKAIMPTTVNPPESGGKEYREVWDNSNQTKADSIGQTNTGLYRIFIPSYIGFDGWITKYGHSVWETPTPEQVKMLKEVGCLQPEIGAKEYLSNTREQKQNTPEDLQEEIRMNPFTAEEVFESANDRCIFNLDALNKRERELVEEMVDKGLSVKNDELGRRGWFKKRGDRVVFEDDKQGLWWVSYLLPDNLSNQFRYVADGERVPTNESFGAGGLDGYVSGLATVDAGSRGCLMIRTRKSSAIPDELSGVPVAMLLGRLENPDDFYEQVYNGLIFYGVKMLAERAPLYFEMYAKRYKLLGYLYKTTMSNGARVYGIPAQQTKNTIDEHARVQKMASLDDHYKIPFISLIRDRKQFSVTNRTKWDVAIADGYSLMALERGFEEKKKTSRRIQYLRTGRVL